MKIVVNGPSSRIPCSYAIRAPTEPLGEVPLFFWEVSAQ